MDARWRTLARSGALLTVPGSQLCGNQVVEGVGALGMEAVFGDAMLTLGEAVRMALRLDPEVYRMAQSTAYGLLLSMSVVLLAALSEAVGQSAVLFLNRLRPGRFALALSIAVMSNLLGYWAWATTIWLTVWLVFGQQVAYPTALTAVGLAYAPQMLALFAVVPYFGNLFGIGLSLWSMAAIVVAVSKGMGLEMWQAAMTGFLTWLIVQVWRRGLGRPIYAVGHRIQRGASGSGLEYSVADVSRGRLRRPDFSANWQGWIEQQSGLCGSGGVATVMTIAGIAGGFEVDDA
jgi:hypothetical protein